MKPKEVYVEIQLLSKHGLSLRQIAAEVGCAVNTVRRHLALEAVPKYERKVKRTTKLAQFEEYLRERPRAVLRPVPNAQHDDDADALTQGLPYLGTPQVMRRAKPTGA